LQHLKKTPVNVVHFPCGGIGHASLLDHKLFPLDILPDATSDSWLIGEIKLGCARWQRVTLTTD